MYKTLSHGELSQIETLSVHNLAMSLMLPNKKKSGESLKIIYCQKEKATSSIDTGTSALLNTALSYSVDRLCTILSSTPLFSVIKIEKFSKNGEQLQHKRCSLLPYYCQTLPFCQ